MSDLYSVAAIIPLYNGARFIREALDSVLAQTEKVDEIFVVDDGSTDDGEGLAIVTEMAANVPITILRKQNGGQSSARNMAVAASTSRLIAFLDQDDAWYEDHIEKLKAPFTEGAVRNIGYVYSNLDRTDGKGRLIVRDCLDLIPTPQPKRSLAECLSHDMFVLPSAALIDREAFLRCGGLDERLAGYEDDDLFVRMFTGGYRSIYVKQSLGVWRQHAASASYSTRMATSRKIYFRKLIDSFPDEPTVHLFWVRDMIAPRFFNADLNEFNTASRLGDVERMDCAWADLLEVAQMMKPRMRRRVGRLGPILPLLYRNGLASLARGILRKATR